MILQYTFTQVWETAEWSSDVHVCMELGGIVVAQRLHSSRVLKWVVKNGEFLSSNEMLNSVKAQFGEEAHFVVSQTCYTYRVF